MPYTTTATLSGRYLILEITTRYTTITEPDNTIIKPKISIAAENSQPHVESQGSPFECALSLSVVTERVSLGSGCVVREESVGVTRRINTKR